VTRTVILSMVAIVVCAAQPRYIGTASCPASFWVDSTGVSNHATLFENSIVETEGEPAKLLIEGGVRVLLDARSRAQVDGKHLVLERGRAQLDSGKDYQIEARTIHVSLSKTPARAIVSVKESGEVEVAALGGMVQVANAEGVAVANVAPGRMVSLQLGPASEAVMLTGLIVKAGERYTLRDEASAVTVELRGTDVAGNTGRRVHVNGSIVPSERGSAKENQVVVAKTIQVLNTAAEPAAVTGSRARSAAAPDTAAAGATAGSADTGSADGAGGGSAGSGSTAGAAGTASTAGGAGASTGIGVSTAVIAGVAVAAAAGTAAAVVASQSHKAPISPGR